VRLAAHADAGLVGERPAGPTPVGSLERAARRQFVEIAPRRLGRHAERAREGCDAHRSLVAEQSQYLRVALVLGQTLFLSRHAPVRF